MSNFLLGDGSVRSVTGNTPLKILRLLGNRADGEILDGLRMTTRNVVPRHRGICKNS